MDSDNAAGTPAPKQTPAATASPNHHAVTRVVVMVLGALGVLMAINQQFLLNLFGFQPLGNAYLYYLIGIFLAVAFLTLPAARMQPQRFTCLNVILVVAALVSSGWLGAHGLDIIQKGWEYDAPPLADAMAAILLVLVLEGVRRAGGTILL